MRSKGIKGERGKGVEVGSGVLRMGFCDISAAGGERGTEKRVEREMGREEGTYTKI